MLEIVEGFPDGIVAISARRYVTSTDYDNALIPLVEEALETHRKVSLYYELDEGFSGIEAGAAFKYALSCGRYLLRWERIAVVTSSVWVLFAMSVFSVLMPRRCRVFTARRADHARGWIMQARPV